MDKKEELLLRVKEIKECLARAQAHVDRSEELTKKLSDGIKELDELINKE